MKTDNTYVRIYQDKKKKINNQKEKIEKEKEKEKEKEEDIKNNDSLPKINLQENIAEIRGNGINFDILPDWEGAKDINEIEIKNDFPLSKSVNIKNLNKNNDYYDFNNENLPNKESKEYLLYNKFSQKPIMKLPNPYIKNSFQCITTDDKIETNETENDNKNNFNREENIKRIQSEKEFNNLKNKNNENYNQKYNQSNNENYKINNIKNNFEKQNIENNNFNNNINKEDIIANNNNKNELYNNDEENNNHVESNNNEDYNKYQIENEKIEQEEINDNNNYNKIDSYNNNYNKNNNKNESNNNNEIYNYGNKKKYQNKNYEIGNNEEKEKKQKFLPKNLNESDIITCSLSDDSLNVTHEQMNILNKEANQLYSKLNHKLSNRIFNLQHPYLERGNNNNYYQEKKKLLEPLIQKQKEILEQNLRKNRAKRVLNHSTSKSIDNMINNSYSQRNMRSQMQNYNNMNNLNMNNMNSISTNFAMPQINNNNINFYNSLNNNIMKIQYNQNLPIINNNNNNIINNNNNNLTTLKKITYKPHTLKEYKENLKKHNYRYPTSLGSNIGSPEWEEGHKKLEKKFEYCKSVQKIEKDIKPKKIIKKPKLNKTEIKEINKEKDELYESKKKELNNYNIVFTEETPNKFKNNKKLPPIPKFSYRKKILNKNNDNNNENENEELNKIISQNKELGALLLSHDLYNSEVEKIKQSL